MSKMKMPEMDAVRFQESDVIVASNVLNLKFYSNDTSGDGQITYKGRTYYTGAEDKYAEFEALRRALDGKEMLTLSKGGDPMHMESVYYFEVNQTEDVITNDGDYIWSGSSWRYRGQ